MADYWRVNSYGYPNPFSESPKQLQAWETLLTFFQGHSYTALKDYWSSGEAPRPLSPHAVESWKAAFEEFGLLYVLEGSDEIRITPAGRQFKDAAESGDEMRWAWVGLNLILRYPLRGPRGSRRGAQAASDLLPYWYLYAAARDLNDYIWFPEIERVIATVFGREQAGAGITLVKRLRAREIDIQSLPLPAPRRRGQFYNSLNQVPNHASLGYMLMNKVSAVAHYDEPLGERRHELIPRWIRYVDLALGGTVQPGIGVDCERSGSFVERMPSAPDFAGDEEAYFAYLGAEITPLGLSGPVGVELREMRFGQGTVVVLRPGSHYDVRGEGLIVGALGVLCRLGIEQRVILAHDLARTYKVLGKQREPDGRIAVSVRRARPISDPSPIEQFLRAEYD
jgi:hypothetical protein